MSRDPQDPTAHVSREAFAAYLGPDNEGMLKYYDQAAEKKKMLVNLLVAILAQSSRVLTLLQPM